jgi:hypothetical protein
VNKKTYFALFIKNCRVIACSDSGSDLTLIQFSLFKKLFPDYKKRLGDNKRHNISIKSFSNNKIEVFGQCLTSVKFHRDHKAIDLTLTVIQDITEAVPQFLFGNDSMRKTLAMIAYTGDMDNPEPEIIIQKPQYLVLQTYYVSPGILFTCRGEYNIGPFSSTEVELHLHPAAPVIRKDEVLVSSFSWSSVQLMESKSDLQFDERLDCFKTKGFLVNLGNKPAKGILEARFEIIENYSSYVVCEETKVKLKKTNDSKSTH